MTFGTVRQPAFGQRLKQLRQERGMSQRDVAGDAVNPSYVSLLESGARVPTLEVVMQLASALDATPDELLGVDPLGGSRVGDDRADRLVHDLITRSSIDYGDLSEAQRSYARAYRGAVEHGAPVLGLGYGIALQDILNVGDCWQDRYELLRELAGLAAQTGVPELAVKVDVELASAARDIGHTAEGVELAERAVSMIDETRLAGTPEHVRALGVLVSVRCDYGDVGDMPALIKQLIEVAERIDRGPVSGHAHWVAAVAYARIGQSEQAKQHIRLARGMFATPTTPLHEWARFSRAAASALLDAGADITEVQQYLRAARSTLDVIAMPGEASKIAVLEVRMALVSDDPARALELADAVPDDITDAERVRLLVAVGRAHARLNHVAQAIDGLRKAASLAEELGQFRIATQVWRELDEVRSARE